MTGKELIMTSSALRCDMSIGLAEIARTASWLFSGLSSGVLGDYLSFSVLKWWMPFPFQKLSVYEASF
jgi:hypothetical protein